MVEIKDKAKEISENAKELAEASYKFAILSAVDKGSNVVSSVGRQYHHLGMRPVFSVVTIHGHWLVAWYPT